MSALDDLLQEFLIESYENLDRLDGEFVVLEEDPESEETLSSIFRTIHTIKGTCGFLELSRLESVTHAGENLLSSLRSGSISLNDEITTALLHLVDAVREMIGHIEQHGEETEDDYAELVATLKRLQVPTVLDSEPLLDDILTASSAATHEQIERGLKIQAAGDKRLLGDIPIEDEKLPRSSVEAALNAQDGMAGDERTRKSSISGNNVRVQVDQLDKLMNLVGELVLARNQILQGAMASQDAMAIATAQQLNLITTELQERIMKVRMQPVGMLWSKFPRIVRDLSKQLGKSVQLQMQGKGTELDKTLLEAIKDPLTHLVRNAVDHGIEQPEVREAAGKDPKGMLLLDAYHESGQVHIEIIDDGGGIDPEAIKAKAVAQGLITPEEAAVMLDRQAYGLIFHAGLSTAKAVTNVSGRGVGMDVVKTNIEKIGGAVEVVSTPGKGTTVRIKIPLTLAIIPALIVKTAGDRYAVPQVSLVELVRLDGEAALTGIEDLHGSPVYRLRGQLLPLLFLDEQLDVKESHDPEDELCRNIVVVRAAGQLFGLVVDDIQYTEEIVVKSLDKQTKTVPVFAGTTILGDGQVALILDVLGLASRAGVLAENQHERRIELAEDRDESALDTTTYLLLRTDGGRRMAIELNEVDRLEEFPVSAIEGSVNGEVVQYRGKIMPLVRISAALGLGMSEDKAVVHVVVHTHNGLSVGLVVDAITDIVEMTGEIVSRTSDVHGVRNTLVIDDDVVDQLDLEALVGSSFDFDDETVQAGQASAEAESVSVAAEGSTQFCTFYLDDLFCGVDVTQVQEVMSHQAMTRVPLTAKVVSGVINLRGQPVTALDMRVRLGMTPRLKQEVGTDPSTLSKNLILRTRDGIVSILVDRIGDVLTLEDKLRGEVPNTVRDEVRDLLTDVYKLPGSMLLSLDVERLVAVSEHDHSV